MTGRCWLTPAWPLRRGAGRSLNALRMLAGSAWIRARTSTSCTGW